MRAFRLKKQEEAIEVNPFTLSPALLPSGSRVVFSFRQNLNDESSKHFSRIFLASDRTPLLARWKPRLHKRLSLPAIYDPTHPFPSIEFPNEITQLSVYPNEMPDLLVTASRRQVNAIRLDNWGKKESIIQNPFRRSFTSISCINKAQAGSDLYLIDNGQIFRASMKNWKLLAQQNIIEHIPTKSALKTLLELDPHNQIFLYEDGQVWLSPGSGIEKLNFQDEDDRAISINNLCWSGDGSLVFNDYSQKRLWHTRLDNRHPSMIFGPVPAGPLYFSVDKKGILYVLDQGDSYLYILLPADHWECKVCGAHRAKRPVEHICPECGAIGNEQRNKPPFSLWLTLDLSSFDPPLGPFVVDEDLNVYIVTEKRYVSVIPFSPTHMWGEDDKDEV